MKKLTLAQYTAKIKNRLCKKYSSEDVDYMVDRKTIFIKIMFDDNVSFIDVCKMINH